MSIELDSARQLLDELMEQFTDLQEEIMVLKEYIADQSNKEAAENSELWTVPDENGGMYLKPMKAIYDRFRNGTRAERIYAKAYKPFRTKLMATITDEVSPENLAYYTKAQSRYFAQLIVGRNLTFAECIREDGTTLEGYAIPWWGNYGPRGTTKRLEEMWANPAKEAMCRAAAERKLASLDHSYRLYKAMGREDYFWSKHPYYETP